MRTLFLLAALLPTVAHAAHWVEIGNTVEARILLDQDSVERSGDEAHAWLKFLYHKPQPGQTVTQGKPFDSSINQYYIVCSTKRYQVPELMLYYQTDTVGHFHGHFDPTNYDDARPATGAMFLLERVCGKG